MSRVMDERRLDVVRRTGLVDSEREAHFDELTKIAAQMLDAPFAFMTVVDDTRSFWKSTHGIEDGSRANSVAESFCQYVIEADGEFIVGDAGANPITAENPSIGSMGVKAWAGFPVRVAGEILGSFCVVDTEPRRWSASDRAILQRLAEAASRHAELSWELRESENAREVAENLSVRYKALLDTLRSSLLPPDLPRIPGIDIAAWFAPADGNTLLGDFYDVFPVGPGRWGIVIGDVCGHGVEAAKLTALARYSLRAAAVHHRDPAQVLAEADAAIRMDASDIDRFATVCYVALEVGDRVRAGLGRAGHPRPVVRSPDGRIEVLDTASGPPLGIVDDATFTVAQTELEPGSLVLLYTDGLTECRVSEGHERLGEDGVVALLETAPRGRSAQDVVSHIAAGLDRHNDVRTDDVAILAFTVSGD